MLKLHALFFITVLLLVPGATGAPLPSALSGLIGAIETETIGGNVATMSVTRMEGDKHVFKVKLVFDLSESIRQDDWQVRIKPSFRPDFHWAPHLTPKEGNVIDQHVFRSPALIVTKGRQQGFVIIPDINVLREGTPVRWYMDMDAEKNLLTLGMSNTRVSDHVLFEREKGAVYPPGRIEFGFYILPLKEEQDINNPFRKPLRFFWKHWGKELYRQGNPLKGDLLPYVEHTYNWAFKSWAKEVWQEFDLDGKRVGAPVFIVNVTQSPNYPGEVNEREFRSIWNQAWFNSLRSASGLYRYARRTGDDELLRKARLTKELALSFPRKNGFFYGLIATEMGEVDAGGKKVNRSKGWNTAYWGNSNRNPYTWDARKSPFHIVDMSWTALLMLRWYDELEPDRRLLEYAETYGKALLAKQDKQGFFPAWLDTETLVPMDYLNDSPETSMSVSFLLKLSQLTGNKVYKEAALKAMDAVAKHVVPTGRWEDFETYWSCCRIGTPDWVGKKVKRNNLYKQCNFSVFWTAEALFECYKETKQKCYLELGQRTLDELLMTQASWQPPFIYVKALGGFGVMNSDGEWNDSRQSLFAELILQYGEVLGTTEYQERGIAALKASFSMMYCPENPDAKAQWEKVWPFFGEADYGFTMENYGHGGKSNSEGEGMGEFTIYDWGNGAAAEAYNRILDKFGDIFKEE